MGYSCYLENSGEHNSIFFLSKVTCARDEIGWDFISMVKSSRVSFTAFCNEMSRRYRTTNTFSSSFRSVDTFVKWIFAWMESMKFTSEKKWIPGANTTENFGL